LSANPSNFNKSKISAAVADLIYVRPGPGLKRIITLSLCNLILMTLTFAVRDNFWLFIPLCIVNGVVYSAAMTTSHDAIHRTLTGWWFFDEAAPRLFSYPIFWPHGIYAELHKLHHKMNGRDLRDPERPTFTQEEYEQAGLLKRFTMRHHIFLSLFVYGGIGMVLKHVYQCIKLWKDFPQLKRAALIDLVGISFCVSGILVLVVAMNIFWQFVLYFLIMERVIGFLHQLRSIVEHYGLWISSEWHLESKLKNCRNVKTNLFMRHLYNGLNSHSVHHAFPAVPFYNLELAHARLKKLEKIPGDFLLEEKSYFRTTFRFMRQPLWLQTQKV